MRGAVCGDDAPRAEKETPRRGRRESVKTRKVSRYYCDYCKKSGCSAPAMKKHERRCMRNPNRECGFCLALEEHQPRMADLVALLPDPAGFARPPDCEPQWDGDFTDAVRSALPALIEAANSCPGCILSALIQRGKPTASRSGYDFKKEVAKFWAEVNTMREEEPIAWPGLF
jgi:hypothetical protein